MKRTVYGCLLALSLCGAFPCVAFAMQDASTTASEPAEENLEQAPKRGQTQIRIDIDAIRARLEMAIKRGEKQLERNKAALDRLNNGESPNAVLRATRSNEARTRPDREEGRPDDRGAEHPDGPRPDPAHRPERVVEVRSFIGEHLPKIEAQLKMLGDRDPAIADRLTMRLAPKIEEIMHAYRSDEELGELKLEELRAGLGFVEAMREYRAAISKPRVTKEEQASAMAEFRAAAEARFEARMRLREHEIKRLTEQLSELSGTLDELRESRDDEIEQMIEASRSNPVHRHRTQKENGSDD